MPPKPDARRAPLKVMFIVSSLGYGGAETLLVNLIRGLDRTRIEPHLICTKGRGPLGHRLAEEISVASYGMSNKFDVRVLMWMVREFRMRRADAVVTVGAGDKMFWGRLAAKIAGVPVMASALQPPSTRAIEPSAIVVFMFSISVPLCWGRYAGKVLRLG